MEVNLLGIHREYGAVKAHSAGEVGLGNGDFQNGGGGLNEAALSHQPSHCPPSLHCRIREELQLSRNLYHLNKGR